MSTTSRRYALDSSEASIVPFWRWLKTASPTRSAAVVRGASVAVNPPDACPFGRPSPAMCSCNHRLFLPRLFFRPKQRLPAVPAYPTAPTVSVFDNVRTLHPPVTTATTRARPRIGFRFVRKLLQGFCLLRVCHVLPAGTGENETHRICKPVGRRSTHIDSRISSPAFINAAS